MAGRGGRLLGPTRLESGGTQACALLHGVRLGEEAGMDHLSGLGDLGLAGRMWSVCVFCLLLKSASLQIHA